MLYDKLAKHAASGIYPMHMPGHKRNPEFSSPGLPYEIDITEIHGFDDLHNPQGILQDTAELAARLYGSDKAFLLVNGSTVGILAAIGAHTSRGDKVLITNNYHRSVSNATSLFGLTPVFITPETDDATGIERSVDPSVVGAALDMDPDIRLVVVTSPSYEGIISDIRAIAGVVHIRGIPLLVDGAHGAHLDFSPGFPGGAVKAGADIVVMSLHKTLPALTQCSLLHACTKRANVVEIERLLGILQTSSPSYVLMASSDRCLGLLAAKKDRMFHEYEQNLDQFSRRAKSLKRLDVLYHGSAAGHVGFFGFDPGKIVILTKKAALSGLMLADTLRTDYKIELELACTDYAIAMTSICDSAEGLIRLAEALSEIDRNLG